MKKWKIEYWAGKNGKNAIEKWLNELTKEQFKSIAKELRMLEEVGNKLRLPHSKALGKGLFELRERNYGYRIYYGFYYEQLIILLAAGNKASQKNDIKIARERLSELERKMKTKKLQEYLEKRLSSSEIAEIEAQALLEVKILRSIQKAISNAITDYMEEKNIGFNELVRRLDSTPAHVAKIQKGEANLTVSSLAHILALLEKEPQDVFKNLNQ